MRRTYPTLIICFLIPAWPFYLAKPIAASCSFLVSSIIHGIITSTTPATPPTPSIIPCCKFLTHKHCYLPSTLINSGRLYSLFAPPGSHSPPPASCFGPAITSTAASTCSPPRPPAAAFPSSSSSALSPPSASPAFGSAAPPSAAESPRPSTATALSTSRATGPGSAAAPHRASGSPPCTAYSPLPASVSAHPSLSSPSTPACPAVSCSAPPPGSRSSSPDTSSLAPAARFAAAMRGPPPLTSTCSSCSCCATSLTPAAAPWSAAPGSALPSSAPGSASRSAPTGLPPSTSIAASVAAGSSRKSSAPASPAAASPRGRPWTATAKGTGHGTFGSARPARSALAWAENSGSAAPARAVSPSRAQSWAIVSACPGCPSGPNWATAASSACVLWDGDQIYGSGSDLDWFSAVARSAWARWLARTSARRSATEAARVRAGRLGCRGEGRERGAPSWRRSWGPPSGWWAAGSARRAPAGSWRFSARTCRCCRRWTWGGCVWGTG